MKASIVVAIIVILILVIILFVQKSAGIGDNVFDGRIYFDNNGTMRPYSAAIAAAAKGALLGNASAAYATEARAIINKASSAVLNVIGAPNNWRVIWTSGASESNNLFIRGLVDSYWSQSSGGVPHIILSAIEHKTSIDCANQLASLGRVTVTYISPGADNRINAQDVASAIIPSTIGISIMHVNNETGIINDIDAINKVAVAAGIPFHTDIVQSFGKIPPRAACFSAASVSFHKLGGLPGTGALIIAPNVTLMSQICGTQNDGMRGGTENVAGIAAANAALIITMTDRDAKNKHLAHLKQYIYGTLIGLFVGTFLAPDVGEGNLSEFIGQSDNYDPYVTGAPITHVDGHELIGSPIRLIRIGDWANTSPNTLMLSIVKCAPLAEHFCNIKLKKDLASEGAIVSIGSACNTNNTASSHVLTAMKLPYIIRCGVIRISLSDMNTEAECLKFGHLLLKCVKTQLNPAQLKNNQDRVG